MASKDKTRKMRPRVTTVIMSVTCMEGDAKTLKTSMHAFFDSNHVVLVSGDELVTIGRPRKMTDKMAETFFPFEDYEDGR